MIDLYLATDIISKGSPNDLAGLELTELGTSGAGYPTYPTRAPKYGSVASVSAGCTETLAGLGNPELGFDEKRCERC